jgi:hypothetical protein
MPSESEPAHRLAVAVRLRLAGLRVSARSVAKAGYLPRSTLERVLRSESSPRDHASLERALGWLAGSVDRVVIEGREPVEVIDPATIHWPREDGDWRAAVEEAWDAFDAQQQESTNAERARRDLMDEIAFRRASERWPSWLTERVKSVLAQEEARQKAENRPVSIVALVEEIVALSHLHEVAGYVEVWADRRENI